MPKDDTMIRRYNELRTRQMAIKKSGRKGQADKKTNKKRQRNDKAPKDLIDQEF
jgi:hypothetical protein